jgi:CRP/FNR family transcriptional regulator
MLQGEKRIYKVSDSGREITLYEVGPGDVCMLNASCILSNVPCPVHAATLTDVEMLLLPASCFRDLVAVHEEMRTFVFSLLSRNIAWIMALIAEVAFRRMDERLMEYLVEKSEDGRLETTHQKIANDLGTAREVVSRLLKDFEAKGLVHHSRHFIQLVSL